jgi:hypothetical protein
MLGHWEPLTVFLRRPGAPLDNNICERALKMAILHRKNSLSYKTQRGAQVGDLFMSLIYTCRLNRANPGAYFMALVRHPKEVLAPRGSGCLGTSGTPWLPSPRWRIPVEPGGHGTMPVFFRHRALTA